MQKHIPELWKIFGNIKDYSLATKFPSSGKPLFLPHLPVLSCVSLVSSFCIAPFLALNSSRSSVLSYHYCPTPSWQSLYNTLCEDLYYLGTISLSFPILLPAFIGLLVLDESPKCLRRNAFISPALPLAFSSLLPCNQRKPLILQG